MNEPKHDSLARRAKLAKLVEAVASLPETVLASSDRVEIVMDGDRVSVKFTGISILSTSKEAA